MRSGLICLVWLLCGSAALAGPWPREAGTGFLSFSVEAPTDGGSEDFYYSGYLEYGQTDWLTLGFDGGSDELVNGEGYAFARVPLPISAGPHKLALLAGVGAMQVTNASPEMIYVLGASWGMGFDGRFGPGWATIDINLRDRAKTETRLLKIDGTAGVNRPDGALWFAQLRYADDDLARDTTLELAPSIALPVTDRVKLETSVAFGLQGSETTKLKLGLWTEF